MALPLELSPTPFIATVGVASATDVADGYDRRPVDHEASLQVADPLVR